MSGILDSPLLILSAIGTYLQYISDLMQHHFLYLLMEQPPQCRRHLRMVPVDVDAVVAAHIVIDGTSKCGVVITVPEIGNRFPEIH